MMTVQEFRRAFERLTSHGWLTLEEAALLVDYAERTQGSIVEVGSYMGRSAMLFAQLKERFLDKYDRIDLKPRQVVCVDPWDDSFSNDYPGDLIYSRFILNMKSIKHANWEALRMRVEDWAPVPAGFCYLDGDHTYEGTRRQIEKALECKPRYIAIHDVNDSGDGADVKRAALEMLGDWLERVGKIAVWSV